MASEREEFLTNLRSLLEGGQETEIARALSEMWAADIAEVFEDLTDEQRSSVLFALPPHTSAEVVILLRDAVREDLVDEMDDSAIREIIAELSPDDAADFLSELDEERSEEILERLPDEKSEPIEELLSYEEDTAGGRMTSDVLSEAATKTIGEVVEDVRAARHDEDLHEVYVVDEEGKLVGLVPLRRLVTHPPNTRLIDLCERDPVTVLATDDQELVVHTMRKYDVPDVAVVDEENRLLGRITHDDVLDVADEEAVEDLFRMAGSDASELESSSVVRAARIRLTWLLPCMAGMLLSAGVMGIARPHFDEFDLMIFGTIALFTPLIGATGGNTGIQISTVIVRGLATGSLESSRLVRALGREGRIAALMAPVCGVMAWALVSLMLPIFTSWEPGHASSISSHQVALAVGSSLCVTVFLAAGLGITLPFVFRRFGVDPAIASGPLVTTANDVLSTAVYMSVAMLIVVTSHRGG
jgi:magnesium transporter